ncbi:MAG: HAD family hydrolase [Nanoarchaeota archaeon]
MIKLICFDFDGTLVDSYDFYFNIFSKILKKHNYKFDKNKLKILLGEKSSFILQNLGVEETEIPILNKEIFNEALTNNHKLKFCDSITSLKKLSNDCKLIIVSNTNYKIIEKIMQSFKIKQLFDNFYFNGKYSKSYSIKMISKNFNIKPSSIVYIGDRFSDIIEAKKARCWSIAIHNKLSWSSLNEIKKQKPDFIINSFDELEKVLNIIS